MRVLFLAALFSLVACSAVRERQQVEVHYLRFGVETFVPVDDEQIFKQCQKCGSFSVDSRTLNGIYGDVVDSPHGSYSPSRIRLRIQAVGRPVIWIDNEGGALISGGQATRRLEEKEFKRLSVWADSLNETR